MKFRTAIAAIVLGILAVMGGAVSAAFPAVPAAAGTALFVGGAAFLLAGVVLSHLDGKERAARRTTPLPTVEVGKQSSVPEAVNALGALLDALK